MSVEPKHPVSGAALVWPRRPFAIGDRDVFRDVRPAGQTIAEMLASVPGLPWERFQRHGRVVVTDGTSEWEVPRELWVRCRPRADRDITVVLQIPLQGGGGGGGGKGIFRIIASIALLAVVTIASGGFGAGIGGGFFAAGSVSAQILGAAVGVVGSLAIAALTPPPVAPKSQEGLSGDRDRSASASGNVLTAGGTIPRPIGTMTMYPPFAGQPLIEIVSFAEEQAECVLALAGPCKLDDIRIAGTPIAEAEDLEYEVREGWPNDPPLTLITRQARQEGPNIEMSGFLTDPDQDGLIQPGKDPDKCVPIFHGLGSRDAADEVHIDVGFGGGIMNLGDQEKKTAIAFRMRIRRRGDEAWRNLPEIVVRGAKGDVKRVSLRLMWSAPPRRFPIPPASRGCYLAYKWVSGQTMHPVTGEWAADPHFSAGAGNDVLMTDTMGTSSVRNVALYEEKAEFYLDPAVFLKGRYEIEVKRSSAFDIEDWNSGGHQLHGDSRDLFFWRTQGDGPNPPEAQNDRRLTVQLARIASIWQEPIVSRPGLALIAIRGRARRLEQISVRASGYVPDYDPVAGTWSNWSTPSHPVAAFRWLLTGSLNADPLPEELVHDVGLIAWRERCIAAGRECHMIADGESADDLLMVLASCGFARPWRSEKWGVIEDRSRSEDGPVQMFNPRNLSGFRFEKAFAKLPHGFLVTFQDAAAEYADEQIVVYADGYDETNATTLETVTYQGLTTEAAVRERAAFDLKQARLRATFSYGEADIEALVASRGDIVAVQHDILDRYSGSARVKDVLLDEETGEVIGLHLDSAVPVNTVPDFDVFDFADVFDVEDVFTQERLSGVAVRLKNGTVITREVYGDAAETDHVFFQEPMTAPGTVTLRGQEVELLGRDCLVQVGSLSREVARMIVADVKPKDDLTATLTLVDEAPELFAA
jgi:hypothetical protein